MLCGVVINAVLLIGLMKAMDGEDADMFTAVLVAFGSSIINAILAYGFGSAMGPPGAFLGVFVGTGVLGVILSAVFGTEIKRAMLISACYFVAQIVIAVVLTLMFRV